MVHHQKWISQNSTKGEPFGSAGGRIPEKRGRRNVRPPPKSPLTNMIFLARPYHKEGYTSIKFSAQQIKYKNREKVQEKHPRFLVLSPLKISILEPKVPMIQLGGRSAKKLCPEIVPKRGSFGWTRGRRDKTAPIRAKLCMFRLTFKVYGAVIT